MPNRNRRRSRRSKHASSSRPESRTVTIAGHHVDGLQEVMAVVQRELARIGEVVSLPPAGTRFSWKNIVAVRPTAGEQTQREFVERTAAIIDAAVVVEHTYDILTGPMPEFLRRLKAARAALTDMLTLVRDRGPELTAQMHNGDITRRAKIAFGAEPQTAPPFDFTQAHKVLKTSADTAIELDTMIASLEARMPDAVVAGFYEPRGKGPLAHCAMLLSDCDLSSEEVSDALGQLPKRDAFEFEPMWRDKRACVIDGVQ
ncbi:MAG: hypothetical protein RL701_6195 [Pseudomonadota bacterium]|jgi:hypothetical protein